MNCSCIYTYVLKRVIVVCMKSLIYISVDSIWSEWTTWSGCLKPCNNGSYMRQRFCSLSLYGGDSNCIGKSEERRPCNTNQCPSQ